MSQQIIFADGTSLDVAVVKGQSIYHQGAQRDSLEIQIAKSTITFDALNTLTADSSKTDRLKLHWKEEERYIDGTSKIVDRESVYNHYVLRTALSLKPIEITPATPDTPAVTEDRLCVTLAQLTYAEVQQAAQAAAIADMQEAITALAFGGGEA